MHHLAILNKGVAGYIGCEKREAFAMKSASRIGDALEILIDPLAKRCLELFFVVVEKLLYQTDLLAKRFLELFSIVVETFLDT